MCARRSGSDAPADLLKGVESRTATFLAIEQHSAVQRPTDSCGQLLDELDLGFIEWWLALASDQLHRAQRAKRSNQRNRDHRPQADLLQHVPASKRGEQRWIDVGHHLAPTGPDHFRCTPFGLGVVRMVTLNLLRELQLDWVGVGNGDRRTLAAAVDRDQDGAPLGKFRHNRLRDSFGNLCGIDRVGQHVIDLCEILGSLR